MFRLEDRAFPIEEGTLALGGPAKGRPGTRHASGDLGRRHGARPSIPRRRQTRGGLFRAALVPGLLAVLAAGCREVGGDSTGSTPRRATADQAEGSRPHEAAIEGTVTVALASSLEPAMRRIAAAFESSHSGARVLLNAGASDLLARQIRDGAPVDIFLSADARSMDEASASGRVLAESRRELVWNALAIVVPSGSPLRVARAEDLLAGPVRRIALCGEGVPLGRYARAWLRSRELLDGIGPRAVTPPDARAALALAEAGAVDAAFVYFTDAVSSGRVRLVFEVPRGETPPIAYSAAALRDGPNPPMGAALLAELAGPQAKRLFAEAGFRTDAGADGVGDVHEAADPR